MTTNTATEALLHKGSGLQVVVGLGQSGLSVAQYLTKQGYQVAVTDNQVSPTLANQLPAAVFNEMPGLMIIRAACCNNSASIAPNWRISTAVGNWSAKVGLT